MFSEDDYTYPELIRSVGGAGQVDGTGAGDAASAPRPAGTPFGKSAPFMARPADVGGA